MRRVIEGKSNQCYSQHGGKTIAAMQTVLYQILNCPYQGMTQRLYLEGKAFELLALRLEQMQEDTRADLSVRLRTDQVDRIYYARDILIARMENPPSIMDLAQQVGINHNKLRQGFHQIFGTTVFGYLHGCRMEKARQLLYEGDLSVALVANMVGYANSGHFASAFKRKFGISPNACRRG